MVSGAGVQPNSPVKVYLLPSTYLGTVTASSTGAFTGTVPIPSGLAAGSYTLQANATGTDGQVRSVSMGVIVQRAANKPASATATVRFAMMSAELTSTAKSDLRSVVDDMGTSGVRSVVLGYVQRAGGSWNDKSLSTSRARAVAAYLRTLGVQGSMAAQGKGVDPATLGPYGRRVDITIIGTG